jgi:hypothetical protein
MHRIERALLTLVVCGGILVAQGTAQAGRGSRSRVPMVEAVRALRVFSGPGEQSRVILRLPAGSTMQVLERRDRWLKVRAGGRTGWITRSSVVTVEPVEARPSRSRRHEFVEGRGTTRQARGTGPRDRMGADATGAGLVEEMPDEARDSRSRRERQRAAARRRPQPRRAAVPRAREREMTKAELADGGDDLGLEDEPVARARPRTRSRTGVSRVAARDTATGAAGGFEGEREPADLDGDSDAELAARSRERAAIRARNRAAIRARHQATLRNPPDDGSEAGETAAVREGADADLDAGAVDRDPSDDPFDEREEAPPERQFVTVAIAQAKLYQYPTARSKAIEAAPEGTRLYTLEREGEWIMVETAGGESGWVNDSDVESGSGKPRPVRKHQSKLFKRASAGLGFAAVAQKFASSSEEPTGTYTFTSGAAVLGLGGELVYDYSARWRMAADLSYRYLHATPGVRYTDPETMAAVDIGFKQHRFHIGGRAGYQLGDGGTGMTLYGSLGFQYDNLRINDVNDFDRNAARLPSEVLSGVTVGALFDVPNLADGWSARVSLDALPLLAGRKQTVGLEDGAASDTFAVWGAGLLQYAFNDTYRASAEYQYAYARTSWTGVKEGSMRGHMADSARRKDGTHLLMLGVGRSF